MSRQVSERMRYLLDVEPAVRHAAEQARMRVLRDLLAGNAQVFGIPATLVLDHERDGGYGQSDLTREQILKILDSQLDETFTA